MESITLPVDGPLRDALESLARGTDGTREEIAYKAILDAAAADRLSVAEHEHDMARYAAS